MPEEKDSGGMSTTAKYTLIGTIVTAVITLITTVVTLYFHYLEVRIEADRTAEAEQARTPTPTLTLFPTPTETPTPTASLTATLTPVRPTATATNPASGVRYCVDIAALNVRDGAGMDFPVVGALQMNDCLFFDQYVLYDGHEGDSYFWVRISEGQADFEALGGRWVYGGFLRPQDFERLTPMTPPPPPARSPTPGG
ncbi:MAG: hypothetical protein JXB85_03470 [Anaerolineales bacterium]|nr:hypothetical protein [Anaerolineales bacterium]